jgi:ABC-2 type transport system ATP-binding protein
MPAVLAALDDVGIRVVTATVARPSLDDDVYLRYAGRSFATAELELEPQNGVAA